MIAARSQSGFRLLSDLLEGMAADSYVPEIGIRALKLDSREVAPGDLFFALAGSRSHGLVYAREAVARGAAALVYDPSLKGEELAALLPGKGWPPMIAVPQLNRKLGAVADRFYGSPSSRLDVIGITGTNGKTSTSHFLAQALSESESCAVIGTLGWGFRNSLRETKHTTPDALSLHAALAQIEGEGGRAVAMEVSSHGQEQGRTAGVRFKGAVYTNITRDHLDYHGSMEAYVKAKLGLLQAKGLKFIVVNLDDACAGRILSAAPRSLKRFGFSLHGAPSAGVSRFDVSNIFHGHEGLFFDVAHAGEKARIESPLFGDFNVENLMSTLATLVAMGIPFGEAGRRVGRVGAVPGRMERLIAGHPSPTVVVDYAHTPHALERILGCLRGHCRKTLWLVFGCGGDRDRGKRPYMGDIAARLADRTVITDDNPRSENGDGIIRDILTGYSRSDAEVIRDRERAIRFAIERAGADDIVVVAGKGHESTQEIQGVKYPFSDRNVVGQALFERFGREGGG